MQTLDLAILLTLLAVIETGSFAAAARKTGVRNPRSACN